MPQLMTELDTGLADPGWHPIVLIAGFVLWFLAIHPFQDGNGRLARILTTMLLIRTGHDWVPFSSLDRVIEVHKSQYYQALRESQLSARQDPTAYEAWLLFLLRAIRAQQQNLTLRIERERGVIGLSPTQRQILAALSEFQPVSAPRIAAVLGIPARTVRYNLQDLAAKRLVSFDGERKGRLYRTAPLNDVTPAAEPGLPAPAESPTALVPMPAMPAQYMTPNARPYASITIDAQTASPQLLTDDVMDAFDAWVLTVRPDAEAWQAGPNIVRWHIPSPDGGGDLWQASLQPAIQVDVLCALAVSDIPGGTAVPVAQLWDYWIRTLRDMPGLLRARGGPIPPAPRLADLPFEPTVRDRSRLRRAGGSEAGSSAGRYPTMGLRRRQPGTGLRCRRGPLRSGSQPHAPLQLSPCRPGGQRAYLNHPRRRGLKGWSGLVSSLDCNLELCQFLDIRLEIRPLKARLPFRRLFMHERGAPCHSPAYHLDKLSRDHPVHELERLDLRREALDHPLGTETCLYPTR